MRVLAPAAAPLLPFVLGGAQQQDEPSIADEIDGLIAKTNGLSSFHVVLEAKSETGHADENFKIEIVYREPWDARITMTKDDECAMDALVDGKALYFFDREGGWRSCELTGSDLRKTLDELFPANMTLGSGIAFDLNGRDGLQLSFYFGPSGRNAVMMWFDRMKRDLAHVAREPEHLVWTNGILELHVSRTTGLLDEIRLQKDGYVLNVLENESSTDVDVDALLAPPAEFRAADEDEGYAKMWAWMSSAGYVRQEAFTRVARHLRDGERNWDARTIADWNRFLNELHARQVEGDWKEKWSASLGEKTAEIVEWARRQLGENDTPARRAAVQQRVKEVEDELAERLREPLEQYRKALPEIVWKSVEPREELFDVERDVIERVHRELVLQPVLDELHERIADVLGR